MISATNAGKGSGPSAQHLASYQDRGIAGRNASSRDEPVGFGSSAVYHCNDTRCSSFDRCAQAVSPWSPG